MLGDLLQHPTELRVSFLTPGFGVKECDETSGPIRLALMELTRRDTSPPMSLHWKVLAVPYLLLLSLPLFAGATEDIPEIHWYELPSTGAHTQGSYADLNDERAKSLVRSEMAHLFVNSQCGQRIAFAEGVPDRSLPLGYATIAIEHAFSFWQKVANSFEFGALHWMTPHDFAVSFSPVPIAREERTGFQKVTLKNYGQKNANRAIRVSLWTWINNPTEFENYIGKRDTLERMTGDSYFHLAYLFRMQLGLEAILKTWESLAGDVDEEAIRAVDLQRSAIKKAFRRVYTGHELVRDSTLQQTAKSQSEPKARNGLSIADARLRLAALERSEIPPATRTALNTYLSECERLEVARTYPVFEAMVDELDLYLETLAKPAVKN